MHCVKINLDANLAVLGLFFLRFREQTTRDTQIQVLSGVEAAINPERLLAVSRLVNHRYISRFIDFAGIIHRALAAVFVAGVIDSDYFPRFCIDDRRSRSTANRRATGLSVANGIMRSPTGLFQLINESIDAAVVNFLPRSLDPPQDASTKALRPERHTCFLSPHTSRAKNRE